MINTLQCSSESVVDCLAPGQAEVVTFLNGITRRNKLGEQEQLIRDFV